MHPYAACHFDSFSRFKDSYLFQSPVTVEHRPPKIIVKAICACAGLGGGLRISHVKQTNSASVLQSVSNLHICHSDRLHKTYLNTHVDSLLLIATFRGDGS